MAEAAGVPRHLLTRLARRGALQRLRRGWYLVAARSSQQDDDYGRARHLEVATTVLAGHPDAVLAGATAAAAWGLPCPRPDGDWGQVRLALAAPRAISLPRGCTSILVPVHGREIDEAAGLPVTSLIRTACDVGRFLPLPNALIVVDAVALRLVGTGSTRERLSQPAVRDEARAALVAAAAQQGRIWGAGRARRVAALAEPAAESAAESDVRGRIIESGLALPEVGQAVVGASTRRYWADLLWREARLIVEVDGRMKYGDPMALFREKSREDDLRAAGFVVRRIPAAPSPDQYDYLLQSLARVLPA